MKRIAIAVALLVMTGVAAAQSANSGAVGQAASDAGAFASTGAVTNNFAAAEQRESQRVHTTPNVYAPPSMFGGANNCMASDTLGIGGTGWGFGGSRSKESVSCNAREDAAIWARYGLLDVSLLRFACFGADDNRKAYEASGRACPSSSTAKGIEGAPVGPKFLVAASVPDTLHMRINQDGTVTRVQ